MTETLRYLMIYPWIYTLYGWIFTFLHFYTFIGFTIGFIKGVFCTHFSYFIVFSFKGAYIVSIVVFLGFYVWMGENRGYWMCSGIGYIDRYIDLEHE